MRVACYTGTRNLYEAMVPAIKSLLIHSNVEKIYLLIEDDIFPYELPDCVETINVSSQTYFKKDGPNMTSHFTYMALMRAAVAKMFPEYDKMLVLDVDTIIEEDISELFDIDLGNNYFAAVPEPDRCKGGKNYTSLDMYTNIGVTLYNLKLLRDSGKVDIVIKSLNKYKYQFMEQDCFNECCQGHILPLSNEYNSTNECRYPFTGYCRCPKVIHYAGIKLDDYVHKFDVQKYNRIPWNEIRK